MKIFFFDLETTGIKYWRNGIHQISGQIVIDGKTKEYNQLIKLLSKYIDKYDKTDKFFLAGYNNASFDNHFLKAFFVQNGDNYFYSWFWVNSIDVMVLASQYLMAERSKMKDFKQETVAKALGIPIESVKLHDATYDIELTKAIWDIITKHNN